MKVSFKKQDMLNQAKLELEKYNTDRTEVELAEAELAR